MSIKSNHLIPDEELKLQKCASLANFTTWRIGGPAEWLAEPTNIDEIQKLIAWSQNRKIPCRIIGAGSNLLISDSGLNGLVICMRKLHGIKLNQTSGVIEAASGESIPHLARKAAKAGLHGLEWAIGIPGTVGGAAVMNAGAQGSCTADWLISVKVMTLDGKQTFEIPGNELNYGYRQSRLQHDSLVVLSAQFQLEPGYNKNKLSKSTNENLLHRITSQPYQLPSCGSVFRNPEPLKAAKLIEELGLKGERIGGAEISKIHSNFIVNIGGATATDVNKLITLVQERVQARYGLLLYPEVKFLKDELKD